MELVTSLGGICARECHLWVPRIKAFLREVVLGWGGVGRKACKNSVPEPTHPSLTENGQHSRIQSPRSHPFRAPVRSGGRWRESKCTALSPLLHPRPITTCLLSIYVIRIITFILKMSCMDMNNLILPVFIQLPL